MKALVVDDSFTLRSAVRLPLEEMKFEITEAKNGEEALKFLKMQTVDLIIFDVHMPVMSGIELAEHLFKLGITEKIPMLMLTSESNEELKQKGKNFKVRGWIIKPINSESLKTIIRQILNIK